MAGNLNVNVFAPPPSEVDSAFKSASTVAPELVFTFAYNFTEAFASG
jgi:hypothetical protein